ncbi:MAG TPA: alkaline phosphatase family protein [Bryobacterales bacterium]|nr:alkaline phosphatase family protein [Bryobacterales bacterium]
MRRLVILLVALSALCAAQNRKTRNLVLVTADGLRRQEVFTGIDPLLMNGKETHMQDAAPLREKLWAGTPAARREKLMPFLWKELAKRGVILGNVEKGSAVEVTNAFRVSYPGYSEILTCRAQDEAIRGNDPIRNPRQTVLEFVRQKWQLGQPQVALFASWSTFRFIGESREGSIFINAGYERAAATPRLDDLSRMQFEALSPWDDSRHDYITAEMALDYLRAYKPRLLYVAFDETDDWAHDRRYDRVLEMAQYFDHTLQKLWETLQSMDEYRDRTTLLVTSDHGRGSQLSDWSDHGPKVPGDQYIWIAARGPDTPAQGEAAHAATVYQRDISATILELLGLDCREFCGGQGKPIERIAPR